MNQTITEKQCQDLLDSHSLTYEEAISVAERIIQEDLRELDSYAIQLTERAFEAGLNIQRDKQRYLTAAQMVSKLYFKYQNYTKALNMLQIIESHLEENTPDWVRLDMNAAMLYSQDHIEYILRNPRFFLQRLDKLSGNDTNVVTQRSALVKSLDQIMESRLNRTTKESQTLIRFYLKKYSLTAPAPPQLQTLPREDKVSSSDRKPSNEANTPDNLAVAQQTIRRLTQKISALEKQGREAKRKICDLENLVAQKDMELKRAAAQETNDESVASLKKNILYFTKEASDLRKKLAEREQKISDLSASLEQSNVTIDQLKTVIKQQDSEIGDLKRTLKQNPLTSYISTKSTSDIILDPKRIRILVIGATRIKEDVVKAIAKLYGFGNSHITVENDYSEIKKLTGNIKPYGSSYDCIIAGPMPHSTAGKDDFSSTIGKWEREEGYPFLIKAENESGELKITKSSLNTAMQKAQVHFQSQGYNVS